MYVCTFCGQSRNLVREELSVSTGGQAREGLAGKGRDLALFPEICGVSLAAGGGV